MNSKCTWVLGLVVSLGVSHPAAGTPGQGFDETGGNAAKVVDPFGSPSPTGPFEVRASFELEDINEVDDSAETFDFTGRLTLEWRDARRAFDPIAGGFSERVFHGEYQVRELAAGWYPQFVLRNEADVFERSGVSLRVRSDGSCTLTETVHAVAESEMDMHRYPFDSHRIEAVFELVDAVEGEVALSNAMPNLETDRVEVPQWRVPDHGAELRMRQRSPVHGGGVVPQFVVFADIAREPRYIMRLVVVPLAIIVLLSFCIFWMDRNAIGDRLNVSFIGILTGVSYLIITSDQLPRISYVTLIHQFLSLSFLVMCATAVVNLAVGALERRSRHDLSLRIDRTCRWLFPVGYLGILALVSVQAFTES